MTFSTPREFSHAGSRSLRNGALAWPDPNSHIDVDFRRTSVA